jgi:uncharacterized damage-inducible protein DinB
MTPAQARSLFAYNRWANDRILTAAAALDTGALTRDLHVSYRSVLGTARHLAWAEWLWLGRWLEGHSQISPNPGDAADLGDLRVRLGAVEQAQRAFVAGLTMADCDRRISYENPPGTTWTYTLGEMLQHLINHSTYHRGQIVGLLRQLGATPPTTDYLVYIDELPASRERRES